MECRAGPQRPPVTNNREDRHLTCMALTSEVLRQGMGPFVRKQVSALTVREHLHHHRLSIQ